MDEKRLLVGYAKNVITPPLGLHIPGHGAVPRPSLGVMDELYFYALAFSDGKTRGILFNCDALGITTAGADRIRERVAKHCGLSPDAVLIACTHCHTAMFLGGSEAQEDPFGAYHRRISTLFCETAARAFADLLPATVRIGRSELYDVGYIRRYRMKDGTLRTNPPYLHPDLEDFDGVQDSSLQLIRFEREGGKEIVLINFGTHPDVVGGQLYTPDWPGYTVDLVKSALRDRSEVILVNGFGGDSNHIDRFAPKSTLPKVEFARRMARKVGGEALRIYDDAVPASGTLVGAYSEIATFGKNPHEEWEEPIAEEIVACKVKTEKELPEHLRKTGMSLKKAARILNNRRHEGDFSVRVFGLRAGPIAFIGVPGEPFSETGIHIKEKSTLPMTVCACRTNGSEGYFPTRRAFDGAGYERDYTRFGPDCSEALERASFNILERMKG